jgi:uncharacterized membrane protein (UPF0127 family)
MFHAHRLVLALLALLVPVGAARAELATFATSTLTIDTQSGSHAFVIELAVTPAQQEQGLMYRREMAPDAGMLFPFREPEIARFWMHNTLIPLDMVFIAADGHIAGIHERAVPMNDEPISSDQPVLAVLELNGGTAARLGIKPGDLVRYAAFGTAPKQ